MLAKVTAAHLILTLDFRMQVSYSATFCFPGLVIFPSSQAGMRPDELVMQAGYSTSRPTSHLAGFRRSFPGALSPGSLRPQGNSWAQDLLDQWDNEDRSRQQQDRQGAENDSSGKASPPAKGGWPKTLGFLS